jgi:protein gp37
VAETAIEWATHVWNPVTGCDRVSPGCAHCYALTYAGRLKAMGQPKYQRDGGKASGPGFGVTLHESALEEPALAQAAARVRQLDERPLPRGGADASSTASSRRWPLAPRTTS